MTAQIKLKHSGGNGVIIEAPASNPASDKTITLPSTESGVFATKDSANSLQNVTGINGGQLSNRNLIINGAMQVAQRGTSSTVDGYGTVDRFKCDHGTVDEAPTQAQVDVTSGTEPYTKGFRKAFKITNGNQTSGAQAASVVRCRYCVEAQDMANSGWNYLSSSSSITLSFYIKSSIAQNFFCDLHTSDGTAQGFSFQTGSLSADTWTKITKTIPGNSNLTFNNDNGNGIFININGFMGTSFTTSGHTLDTWGAFTGSSRMPDNTTTWYTTNNSTLEITGVQLEVGSVATDFEHRSFAQEFALCQRYFEKSFEIGTAPAQSVSEGVGYYLLHSEGNSLRSVNVHFKVPKRTDPTMTYFNPYAANANARLPFSSTDLAGIATNTLSNYWFSFHSSDNTPSPTLAHLMWTASAEL